ncbi:Regulatory sensor-transducer, BlaR1/MecR1 family [Rhodopirellula islandica]|uniref:Regulatory sensor-transducer, BlaR1/MecR1 family n=2 Tax=Rhodopirellula islandica TaxID=595434 RepID=A0A0J1EMQ1_RHOIS|nr:Regulatory sensor-transducer, BlaR1/MecR1 family [Rhodopirellula islandica]
MESTWATQLGWVLLNSVWQFALIAIGIAAIRSLLPDSAKRRHRLACLGKLAMGLCPLATWHTLSRSIDSATMMSNLPVRLSSSQAGICGCWCPVGSLGWRCFLFDRSWVGGRRENY